MLLMKTTTLILILALLNGKAYCGDEGSDGKKEGYVIYNEILAETFEDPDILTEKEINDLACEFRLKRNRYYFKALSRLYTNPELSRRIRKALVLVFNVCGTDVHIQ